jgi:uncharacterized protein (DUF1330 family)
MSAYFVVELEITNSAAMEPYRAAVGATIEQYGGRFLARAGATELIEGGPEPKRIVILEFADKAAFKRWYDSPEYQKILPGRLGNSTGRAFIVEGVSYDAAFSIRLARNFRQFRGRGAAMPSLPRLGANREKW